jgi:hypothetical protein
MIRLSDARLIAIKVVIFGKVIQWPFKFWTSNRTAKDHMDKMAEIDGCWVFRYVLNKRKNIYMQNSLD